MANHAFYGNISSPVPNLTVLTGTYRFQEYDVADGDFVRFQSKEFGTTGESIVNGFSLDPNDAPDLGSSFDKYDGAGFVVGTPSTHSRGYVVFKDKWLESQLIGLSMEWWPTSSPTPTDFVINQLLVPMTISWSTDALTGLPYIMYGLFRRSNGGNVSDTNISSDLLNNATLSVTAYMRNSAEVY